MLTPIPAALARPGDLDRSFSKDGKLLLGRSGPADVDVQADGRTVVLRRYAESLAVTRLTSSGRLDQSFGAAGVARIDFGPDGDAGAQLIPDGDGAYLVVGSRGFRGELAVARLDAQGELDTSFGTRGVVIHPLALPAEIVDAARAPGGAVVIVARLYDGAGFEWAVARITSDGTLDRSFSDDGQMTLELGANAQGYAAAVDESGRIVTSGVVYLEPNYSSAQFTVARLLEDGGFDPSFGGGDGAMVPTYVHGSEGAGLAPTSDGGVLIAGFADVGDFAVERLSQSGETVSSFGDEGIARARFPGNYAGGRWVGVDAKGRILAAGVAAIDSMDVSVARFSTAGQPDPSFGLHGGVATPFGPETRFSDEFAVAADFAPHNRLTVVGGFEPEYATAVARYRLGGRGRRDRDADGVRDRRDSCPSLYEERRPGCPRYDSTVSIDYTGRKFRGRVRPEYQLCSEYPDRFVRVYRARPGADRLVGRTEIQYPTFWEVNALNRRGRFYAVAERILDSSYGICSPAKSQPLTVSQGGASR